MLLPCRVLFSFCLTVNCKFIHWRNFLVEFRVQKKNYSKRVVVSKRLALFSDTISVQGYESVCEVNKICSNC